MPEANAPHTDIATAATVSRTDGADYFF